MINRTLDIRQSSAGNPLFSVTIEAEFDFVCALDGSKHTAKTFGEAMDSGDKATNKAMSAAYKYACLQTFCIPTEGDNDADATTHQVAPRTEDPVRQAPAVAKAPARAKANAEKLVGEEEVSTITKLASMAGVPLETIAGKYGLASIEELPLFKTAEVVARLQEIAKSNAIPKE